MNYKFKQEKETIQLYIVLPHVQIKKPFPPFFFECINKKSTQSPTVSEY